jgi:hypothetical protein
MKIITYHLYIYILYIMDLYSTSAGSISQGNVRRRGVESAHASQRARIQDIGKNWSDAQKNFDEQRDSNVEQVQQAGELREIKDQIGNAFAVSSMPAKIKSFQKWSQGGVNDIGGKITNPSSVKMGEMAKGDLKALGNSQSVSRGASEALTELNPMASRAEQSVEMLGKDGKAGIGSRLYEGAKNAVGMSEETAERLGKGAGMLGGAVIAGNDIAADLKGGLHIEGNNTLEKVSNVSGIIGGVADIGGAFFPPLELLGGVAGLISGVSGAIGDFEDTLSQEDKAGAKTLDKSQEGSEMAQAQVEQSKSSLAGAVSTALGRTN